MLFSVFSSSVGIEIDGDLSDSDGERIKVNFMELIQKIIMESNLIEY